MATNKLLLNSFGALAIVLGAAACSADSLSEAGPGYPNPQPNPNNNPGNNPGGNSNINLGGAQDFGYFRRLLEAGMVPEPKNIDAAGFFAEHHTPLPEPACGERVCLQ